MRKSQQGKPMSNNDDRHNQRHQSATLAVLRWYQDNARDLPWRTTPAMRAKGVIPNPYHVWLSEMMLQQTTVATVKAYFEKFITIWPTVADLAAADRDDVMSAWAGLGYYARARNLHKAAGMVVEDFGGVFPQDETTLRSLPGVGPYAAAAISAIAFGRKAVVVDGNIERIMARWDAVTTPLPKVKPALYHVMSLLTPEDEYLAGDFAQALMDIGSSICTAPRKSSSSLTGLTVPSCLICPLHATCISKNDAPERLPRKLPKKPRPDRYGHVLLLVDAAGHIVLTKRPDEGLLGGLDIFPTNDWPDGGGLTADQGDITDAHPAWLLLSAFGRGARLNQPVDHIFSHFRVLMTVEVITLDAVMPDIPNGFSWAALDDLSKYALPTVMMKCVKAAQLV